MKTPKILPRGKLVLIQQEKNESRESKHGIITPSNIEQEQRSVGIVMAVGQEIKDIKKGDRVVYGAFAGEKLRFKEGVNETELTLLFDEDVIAFIKE